MTFPARLTTLSSSVVIDLFGSREKKRKVKIETPHFALIPLILEKDNELIATMPLSPARYFAEV